MIGWLTIGPVVFGGFFGGAIFVQPPPTCSVAMGEEFHGPGSSCCTRSRVAGVSGSRSACSRAWYLYLKRPDLPDRIAARISRLYRLLVNKYYFDWFNENVFAGGEPQFRHSAVARGDETVIDGGWSTAGRGRSAGSRPCVRRVQSGYLYHYAFAMIIGLSLLLGWLLLR